MIWMTDYDYSVSRSASEHKRSAFFKSRDDITFFARDLNVNLMRLPNYYDRDETSDIINAKIDASLSGFRNYDTLILQFPFFTKQLNLKVLIDKIHHDYSGKVYAFIHDYEPLRWQLPFKPNEEIDEAVLQEQFSYDATMLVFSLFDGIIVNNDRVATALVEQYNFDGDIVIQGPFGYRCLPYDEGRAAKFKREINFCGTLSKAKYLQSMPEYFKLNVYGENPAQLSLASGINYQGSVPETELPSHLQVGGGFGLVWDSEEFSKVSGPLGEYTKLSYAHKISLYLAANMPIIIWREAAGAEWLVKNNLGIAVNSLAEAWDIVNNFEEAQYAKMVPTLIKFGQKVRAGVDTKKAILQVWQNS